MKSTELFTKEYQELLNQQEFDENRLDYEVLKKHKLFLTQLAMIANSGVTVFDLYRKEHVFASHNFNSLFGYDFNAIEKNGNDYFNSRTHTDDLNVLYRNAVLLFKFLYQLPREERPDFKLINEYRILNAEGKFVRAIEQHQMLELDHNGNIWLALSVLDISPNQGINDGVKSILFNYKTGKLFKNIPNEGNIPHAYNQLTKREKEVLELVKDGLMSKEISDKLFISLHTVNTHRQRILEKLGADNSLEAVKYASHLGLI
jgi:DNA-binding CsgD family transcriptional regulator/PAS domain-containing protein